MTRSGQGRSHDPQVQERLRELAGELRHLLYGEEGCPEWGTQFAEMERDGVAVGSELGRLLIEQSVDEQAERMPAEALQTPEEPAQPAGSEGRRLQTEVGEVAWEQPRGYLKQARRSFSPSGEGAGD